MLPDRTAAPPEVRVVPQSHPFRLERRADGGEAGATLVGHAAVFDQWTTLYQGRSFVWREIVRPGAFAAAIAEAQDVRALWNHEAEHVLGRTASGTCRLAEDATGLAVEVDLPDTQLARDLGVLMARGDVNQMSFAFRVRKGGERTTIREEDDLVVEERELLALDLYDVSPVAYPAYEGTDCALRAEGERREREARQRQGILPRPGATEPSARRRMALRLMPVFKRA